MSRHRTASFIRSTRTVALSLLVVVGVGLTACGPLGDDDTDPTSVSESIEQPTGESSGEETITDRDTAAEDESSAEETQGSSSRSTPPPFTRGTPVASDGTDPTTEVVSVSTPAIDLEDDGAPGTAVPGIIPSAATPIGNDGLPTAATEETLEDDSTGPASFGGSDGTSGATPDLEPNEPSTVVSQDAATPFFISDEATPDASGAGTPSASPVALTDAGLQDLEPVVVTSCDPEIVPVIMIKQVSYLTNADVNFRTGPGAACDLIGTDPIGINTSVTLVGGPVAPEDDDFVWVQVEIAGEIGWIVIDVLEPAV